jgi:D-beta-D-heptose 7-phosphate kinase/D-beta-D-heptose 1-phosphate adenosyltransferase
VTHHAAGSGRLEWIVERFGGRRVMVVGDVMIDHFVYGRVSRISPEAPVPVVLFDHEEFRLGGAANVAHNLAAFGGAPILLGLVGEDEGAHRIVQDCVRLGVDASGLVSVGTRPTTRKMRLVTTRNQQIARIDYEQEDDLEGTAEQAVIDATVGALDRADAVVVSDYLKGAVTARLMREVVGAARRRGVAVLVDPKIPHLDYYRGATLVTPNHHEAELATGMRIRGDDDARRAARTFRERAGCDAVLITRGEHGMWLLDGPPAAEGSGTELALDAVAREVADVTGAGDTVIATMALAVATGAGLPAAARLANHAAGIAVSKFGPAVVTREELQRAIQGSQ